MTSNDATDAKTVVAGTYYVSESPNPPTNYTASATTCFNDLNGNGTQDSGEPNVTVGAGGSVALHTNDVIVCSITNTYNQAAPTLATTLSSLVPVAVGTTVHDSASFTGYRSPATGATSTVTYTVYDNNTCTSNANNIDAGTVNVDKSTGSIPNSNAIQFNTAGDYYWQASFSGDDDNTAVKSVCTSEHLVVNKAQPSIATSLSSSSITVGGSVHDSSTLTGATAGAGGTVDYKVYDNNTCAANANTVDAGTKTVTAHIVPDSDPVTFNTAGDYYWQASYSGDTNNAAATSPCLSEHLVVNKAQPTIATSLSSSSITVGGSVHDSSTLTGASTNAGGTVLYTVYSNSSCTTMFASGGTKTVTAHIVPDSDPVTFNTAGDYYWQAAYSGDTNNAAATSPCLSEHLVVNKATPSIATSLSSSSITVGGSVHDSSTLTGATATAGGTVNYKVYDNNTCTTNANTVDAGTKTVTAHIVPDSDPVTFNTAGDYYWQASYSGDTNNVAATSACLSEHLVVNKAQPVDRDDAVGVLGHGRWHGARLLDADRCDRECGRHGHLQGVRQQHLHHEREHGRRRHEDGDGPHRPGFEPGHVQHRGRLLLAGLLQRRREQRGRDERMSVRAPRRRQDHSDDRDEPFELFDHGRRLGARLLDADRGDRGCGRHGQLQGLRQQHLRDEREHGRRRHEDGDGPHRPGLEPGHVQRRG